MNRRSKNLLFLIIVLIIFVMSSLTYLNWPHCDKTDFVDTSVTIKSVSGKGLLGFNTNTDSLIFGTVSPAAQVIRSINTQYSKDAFVSITPEGDFSSWIRVNPLQFYLPTEDSKEVFFELNVPPDTLDGEYSGKVKFCFKNK